MNRRSFLTMLGLAPIAAPLIAKAAIEDAPLLLNRVSDGKTVGFNLGGTSQGIISVAGHTDAYGSVFSDAYILKQYGDVIEFSDVALESGSTIYFSDAGHDEANA